MSTAIRERPILFSGPMVTAIRAGRKTMTRRVVKPQPPASHERHCWFHAPVYGWTSEPEPAADWFKARCPYGVPGDRLWVRETFYVDDYRYPDPSVPPAEFLAAIEYRASHDCANWEAGCPCSDGVWRPSIHMPRWASRITLEITEVRVERLQEITPVDARAEGVECPDDQREHNYWGGHLIAFHSLWDSINGERPGCAWKANPWVWVVTFRRLQEGDPS